jgi:hypothetical protein
VTFVDETEDVEASYVDPVWTPESLPSCASPIITSPLVTIGSHMSNSALRDRISPQSLPLDIIPQNEALRGIPISDLLSNERVLSVANRQYDDDSLDLEPETPGFRMKIQHHHEALLIRHYTENLADWVSLCTTLPRSSC